MKKILLGLVVLVLLVGCTTNQKKEPTDAEKIKEEYEALNGQANQSSVMHKTITLSDKNPLVYASGDDVISLLKEGSGIIYFGFPECPWCRAALPVFLEACEEELITQVLYYNNRDQRDVKELKGDTVVTTKEGSEEYYQILDLLGEYASEYDGLNDPSIKRLYYPTMVFVSEGKIVDFHQSVVEGVTDPHQDMTPQQIEELKSVYKEAMKKVKGACNSAC
ncbi:MAG: hypothetical protein PUF50_03580 [Erysipelotrichaceae bacterium]|nr:hypothetical protein [Erysipelotrichaceae bacterium]